MLKTPWGEKLDRGNILSEYPRPQLERSSYFNLNGRWQYAFAGDQEPAAYDGTIIVPFSPESLLSDVGRNLRPDQTLWYKLEFSMPPSFYDPSQRLLLHFGAVDQEAWIYLNGAEVAHHIGGYTAFTADITSNIQPDNILIVRVKDETDQNSLSRGKQKTKRGGIWYTPQSGIWQTVWMEAVPANYITELLIIPQLDTAEVALTVFSREQVTCTVNLCGRDFDLITNQPSLLPMPDFKPWTPETPHLYDFTVTMGEDHVHSYFGMRSVCVAEDSSGIKRLFLNGKPYFHNGLLDQGYWPDGLYTAPSDEALIFDIQTAKNLGFNMLRKHIKIEPMRWYYHCDRIGVLVWQDMVSGGGAYRPTTISMPLVTGIHQKDNHYRRFARQDPAGRDAYYRELDETVIQLRSVTSLVLWVPFNEGWGQFDSKLACEKILALDPTRPIDHASGWHDQGIGDLKSLHVYFRAYKFKPDRLGRAVILSEFGGYNLYIDGHTLNATDFGYKKLQSKEALWNAYSALFEREIIPVIPLGLAATVYTQLTDVEDELNGLITYDRRIIKFSKKKMRALNKRVQGAL